MCHQCHSCEFSWLYDYPDVRIMITYNDHKYCNNCFKQEYYKNERIEQHPNVPVEVWASADNMLNEENWAELTRSPKNITCSYCMNPEFSDDVEVCFYDNSEMYEFIHDTCSGFRYFLYVLNPNIGLCQLCYELDRGTKSCKAVKDNLDTLKKHNTCW